MKVTNVDLLTVKNARVLRKFHRIDCKEKVLSATRQQVLHNIYLYSELLVSKSGIN